MSTIDMRVIEAAWMRPIRPRKIEVAAIVASVPLGTPLRARVTWATLVERRIVLPPTGYIRAFRTRGLVRTCEPVDLATPDAFISVRTDQNEEFEVADVMPLKQRVALSHPLTAEDALAFGSDPRGMLEAERLARRHGANRVTWEIHKGRGPNSLFENLVKQLTPVRAVPPGSAIETVLGIIAIGYVPIICDTEHAVLAAPGL